MEFTEGVARSAQSGQPVDLPIEADHPLFKGWVAR